MAAADRAGDWSGPAWTVRSAIRSFRRAHPDIGDDVCVALSGGADSLALLAASVAEFRSVTALVVDHGLQAGSAGVARVAAEAARELGAKAQVLVVVVDPDGTGPEAAARTARYGALESARAGRPVLLGHTLDDQAETVLLGLGRGSGQRSLRGMAERDGAWARPLLGVRAADTRGACGALGLDWWEDPHNVDPAFTRVRVRREVLPLLEGVLGGGVAPALARSAALMADDDDALEHYAQQVRVGSRGELAVADLEPLPRAVMTRVLRRWLLEQGVAAFTYGQLMSIAALVTDWRGQGGVALGGGPADPAVAGRLVARRRHGTVVVENDRDSGAGH